MSLNWKDLLISLTITPSNRNYNCKQDLDYLWMLQGNCDLVLQNNFHVQDFFKLFFFSPDRKVTQTLTSSLLVTVPSSFSDLVIVMFSHCDLHETKLVILLMSFFLQIHSLSTASHHWSSAPISVSILWILFHCMVFSYLQVTWFTWSTCKTSLPSWLCRQFVYSILYLWQG